MPLCPPAKDTKPYYVHTHKERGHKMKQHKQNKTSKLNIAILLSLLLSVLFFILYNLVIKTYLLKKYDSSFFVFKDMIQYLSLPFILITFAEVIYYFFEERKVESKKYITISSIISIVVLAVSAIFTCSVWVVSDKGISYNTFITEEKITYSYDDIETVTVCYGNAGLRPLRGETIIYNITMNDGEKIEFQFFNSYYENYNSLIEFDKKVASKRKTVGEFTELEIPEEINDYYRNLFKNQL